VVIVVALTVAVDIAAAPAASDDLAPGRRRGDPTSSTERPSASPGMYSLRSSGESND